MLVGWHVLGTQKDNGADHEEADEWQVDHTQALGRFSFELSSTLVSLKRLSGAVAGQVFIACSC